MGRQTQADPGSALGGVPGGRPGRDAWGQEAMALEQPGEAAGGDCRDRLREPSSQPVWPLLAKAPHAPCGVHAGWQAAWGGGCGVHAAQEQQQLGVGVGDVEGRQRGAARNAAVDLQEGRWQQVFVAEGIP